MHTFNPVCLSMQNTFLKAVFFCFFFISDRIIFHWSFMWSHACSHSSILVCSSLKTKLTGFHSSLFSSITYSRKLIRSLRAKVCFRDAWAEENSHRRSDSQSEVSETCSQKSVPKREREQKKNNFRCNVAHGWKFTWVNDTYPFSINKGWVLEPIPFWILWTLVPGYKLACASTTFEHKDASSTEGVAQCITEVNSNVDRTDYPWVHLLLQIFVMYPFPTVFHCWDDTPLKSSRFALGKPAIFWFQLGTKFSGSEAIYFWLKFS